MKIKLDLTQFNETKKKIDNQLYWVGVKFKSEYPNPYFTGIKIPAKALEQKAYSLERLRRLKEGGLFLNNIMSKLYKKD